MVNGVIIVYYNTKLKVQIIQGMSVVRSLVLW